jgi:hypothetical protein
MRERSVGMKRYLFAAAVIALTASIVFFSGCSSGGGGGTTRDDSAISGTFTGGYFSIDPPSSYHGDSGYFGLSSDGAGNMLYDEEPDGSYDDDSMTYEAYTDGSLSIVHDSRNNGGYNATGDTAVLADAEVVSDPYINISVIVKDGSGMSDSSFSGDYVSCRFTQDTFDQSVTTTLLSVEAQGDGSDTATILSDSSGGSGAFTITYDIEDNGRADVTIMGSPEEGMIRSDGGFGISMDTDDSDADLAITVFLKKGSGLSEATVNGTYNAVLIGASNDDGWSYWTEYMEISSDGDGSVSAYIVEDSGDDDGKTEVMPITVASDGIISIGGDPMGAVSADGSVFVMADTTYDGGDDTDVWLLIGIRKH